MVKKFPFRNTCKKFNKTNKISQRIFYFYLIYSCWFKNTLMYRASLVTRPLQITRKLFAIGKKGFQTLTLPFLSEYHGY